MVANNDASINCCKFKMTALLEYLDFMPFCTCSINLGSYMY